MSADTPESIRRMAQALSYYKNSPANGPIVPATVALTRYADLLEQCALQPGERCDICGAVKL